MNKLITSIAVFGLLTFVTLPAIAATSVVVNATVTANVVAISVDDGVVEYGTLDLSTQQNTFTLDDTQTATNDGNVNVDLGIRSSDATSTGTDWNLAASIGIIDEFTHEFSTNSGSTWTDFNPDNNSYSTIASGVTPTNSQGFDLQIGTPSASTDIVEHTVTVTVLATAS